MNIYKFIAAEKANFPVSFMCEHLEVSTSSYYEWIQAAEPRAAIQAKEDALVAEMRTIHKTSHGTYGEPRMTPALRAMGFCVNHKRVERLMQKHQIIGYTPKRKVITTVRANDADNVGDLVKRDFIKPKPDIAWCGDISYIRTWEGWLFLATVIDLGSRRVIGYAMADHMRTELIEDALKIAVKTRGKPKMNNVVFHSDKGSQYTSADFEKTSTSLGIIRSVGRKATCFDNAVAESFFATLKKEMVYRTKFATRKQARTEIFNYIEGWYNTSRLHSTIGYMSPVEWERTQQKSTTITDIAA
jgi:putative transposase